MEYDSDATWLRESKKDINEKNKQARVEILQEKIVLDGVQGF